MVLYKHYDRLLMIKNEHFITMFCVWYSEYFGNTIVLTPGCPYNRQSFGEEYQ